MLSCQGEDEKISVQSLSPLKTRAKDDEGKTYWIYPAEDYVDDYDAVQDMGFTSYPCKILKYFE